MPDSAAKAENPNNPESHYILRIKDHLSSNWSAEFEGLTVSYSPTGETLLTGLITDQSALHGLLARIRDLNLTLISVNRVAAHRPAEDETGETPSGVEVEE